jgi:hypothetical protein
LDKFGTISGEWNVLLWLRKAVLYTPYYYWRAVMFSPLPLDIRATLLRLLMNDNMPAAKRLYEAWTKERPEEIT